MGTQQVIWAPIRPYDPYSVLSRALDLPKSTGSPHRFGICRLNGDHAGRDGSAKILRSDIWQYAITYFQQLAIDRPKYTVHFDVCFIDRQITNP